MTRDWLKIKVRCPFATSSASKDMMNAVLHEVSTPATDRHSPLPGIRLEARLHICVLRHLALQLLQLQAPLNAGCSAWHLAC